MINLNSIYDYSKRIIEGNRHLGVSQFTYGDVYTVYNTGENKFPSIHASLQELNREDGTISYKFNIFYIDRLLENNLNENEIIDSGYLAIGQYLNNLDSGFNRVDVVTVDKDSTYNVFVEDFADKCAGVWVEVDLTLNNKVGNCVDSIIPFDGNLHLTRSLLEFPWRESTDHIGVETDTSWVLDGECDWVEVTPHSGVGSTGLTINVEENTTSEKREFVYNISTKTTPLTLKIVQYPRRMGSFDDSVNESFN